MVLGHLTENKLQQSISQKICCSLLKGVLQHLLLLLKTKLLESWLCRERTQAQKGKGLQLPLNFMQV